MWCFSNLFTNTEIHNHLKETVREGKIGHAQIFYGQEGSEALPTAFAFIKYIFCENKNKYDACNKCASCKQMDALSHPDFKIYFPFPFVKGKIEKSADLHNEFVHNFTKNPYMDLFSFSQKLNAEKKTFSIPTTECESINKFLSLKSFYGGKKVVLIWYPESLNHAGANKILKTIEEPSGDTLILFVTHNIHEVLPTIMSRCQTTVYKNPDAEQIKNFLKEKSGLDSELNTDIFSSLSGYNLGEINEMISNIDLFILLKKFYSDFTDFIFNKTDPNLIFSVQSHIELISGKGREFTKYFLKYFLNTIRKEHLIGNRQIKIIDFIIFLHELIEHHIMLVERNVSIKMVLLSLLISGRSSNSNNNKSALIKETFFI